MNVADAMCSASRFSMSTGSGRPGAVGRERQLAILERELDIFSCIAKAVSAAAIFRSHRAPKFAAAALLNMEKGSKRGEQANAGVHLRKHLQVLCTRLSALDGLQPVLDRLR